VSRNITTKFQKDIRNIAEQTKQRRSDKVERRVRETDLENKCEIKDAMEKFFSLAKLGVRTYSKFSGEGGFSVYELPEELLTLFLNLPGKRIGFCIIGPERFVVFLDELPNQVLVFGQMKQSENVASQILANARQLIKITCLRSGSELVLKDNTGANLNPEDVIKHIIKWVSG
jgi:hypothetical protein